MVVAHITYVCVQRSLGTGGCGNRCVVDTLFRQATAWKSQQGLRHSGAHPAETRSRYHQGRTKCRLGDWGCTDHRLECKHSHGATVRVPYLVRPQRHGPPQPARVPRRRRREPRQPRLRLVADAVLRCNSGPLRRLSAASAAARARRPHPRTRTVPAGTHNTFTI